MATATNHDYYVTGNGGLFQLDPTHLDPSTQEATISLFGSPTGSGFSTGLSFLPGSGTFVPFGGDAAGRLAYIPDFNSTSVMVISAISVPEPSGLMLAAAGGAALLLIVRRRK